MKKTIGLLLILTFPILSFTACDNDNKDDMSRNLTSDFTCPNFKAYMLEKFDTNKNGKLEKGELEAIESIGAQNLQITSLDGLEHCKNISQLDVSYNLIEDIDTELLLELPKLTTLYCYGNKLRRLDVSHMTNLAQISCSDNILEELKLYSNDYAAGLNNLEYILCENNKIEELDITNCFNLISLKCRNNKIKELNTSNSYKMMHLLCSGNQIETLNIMNNPELWLVDFQDNPLKVLYVSDIVDEGELIDFNTPTTTQIKYTYENPDYDEPVIFKCENFKKFMLEHYDTDGNGIITCSEIENITELDVSNQSISSLYGVLHRMPKLRTLKCNNNNISSLQFWNNFELEHLEFANNNLYSSLELIGLPKLKYLDCSNTNLGYLRLGDKSHLKELYCRNNRLTALTIAQAPNLQILDLTGNEIRDVLDEYFILYVWEGFEMPSGYIITNDYVVEASPWDPD